MFNTLWCFEGNEKLSLTCFWLNAAVRLKGELKNVIIVVEN